MRLYHWQGCDKKGRTFHGVRWAAHENQVAGFVRSQYGYVLKIKTAGYGYRKFFGFKHLTIKERGLFFGRLSILLDKGIPIFKGLEIIGEKSELTLNRVCSLLTADLAKGLSCAAAMQRQSKEFGPLTVCIVEAGEVSGELALMFRELADYYLKERAARQFLFNACLYPGVVLVLTMGTMVYFFFRVLPAFGMIYQTLGITINPFLETVLRSVENILKAPELLTAVFICVLCGLAYVKDKLPDFFFGLPIIKKSYKEFLEIRYCRLLGLLLTSGITLIRALALVEGTLSETKMRQAGAHIRQCVMSGSSLGAAVSLHKEFFGQTTREFIIIGETGGNLDTMLAAAADVLAVDMTDTLKNLKVLLEPALLLLLAILVSSGFFILLSLLYELLNALNEI